MFLIDEILHEALRTLHDATLAIATPLPFFVLLSMFVKRDEFLAGLRRAVPEGRLNLLIHFSDAFLVAPLLVALLGSLSRLLDKHGVFVLDVWDDLNPVVAVFATVLLGDFIGYWRHRLEHTSLLWPSHVVHHSDTAMTWLTVFRFHPFNRLTTTVVDSCILIAMGVPPFAVLVNGWVRHYYGALIHADLPWTYGCLRFIFVSPAMHRWHHALDPRAYNTNFATVFAFFDWVFGTLRVPGTCDAPLGVSQRMSPGFLGQMFHPLKLSSYAKSKGEPDRRVSSGDQSPA